jgi:hypothetical protein
MKLNSYLVELTMKKSKKVTKNSHSEYVWFVYLRFFGFFSQTCHEDLVWVLIGKSTLTLPFDGFWVIK